jgi:glycosyltransferase involved in cell wall biosynthesis
VEFAFNAIFSFSNAPIRLTIYIGSMLMLLCIAGGAFLVYLRLCTSFTVPGITATILTVIMMGGIQVFMLGILGEYIGRIFEESKQRPLYLVENVLDFDANGARDD